MAYADLYFGRGHWQVRVVYGSGCRTDWPIRYDNGFAYNFPERIPHKVKEIDVPAAFDFLAVVESQPALLVPPRSGDSMKVPGQYRRQYLDV
ncbi:MAG: hypothetical protein JXA93_06345 [Anaerolineae bacterium]|nr:hypothetical protein [Anaerolineae bacterium]